MRKTIFLLLAAFAMTAALSGVCEAAVRRVTRELPFTDTKSADVVTKNVEGVLDRDFELVLDANPTTGAIWSEVGAMPPGLSLVSVTYLPPPYPNDGDGAGGLEKRIYRATASGRSRFYLQYGKPSEPPTICLIVAVNIKVN